MENLIDWNNFNSTLLIEVTRPEGVFTSSGVAVDRSTILTAAHCLEGEILKVRVSTGPDYQSGGKFLKVKSFELHPHYNQKNSNYLCDLGKIKLCKKLPKSIQIYPIIKNDHFFRGKIYRLGFGSRGNKNVRTLITPELKDIRKDEQTIILNDKYSFSGDSGGPVYLQNQGQMYLVAIHSTLSFSNKGEKYSFNPLLSPHREWIAS